MDKIKQLQEMTKMDSRNPLLHYTLGVEYLKIEDYQKAVEVLRESLRLKETYSAAYRELGRALEKAGLINEAEETYQKGIKVAEEQGDIQTAKEMGVFLKRIWKSKI